MKFSLTIPTNLQFHGPPVTPIDPTTGYVRQPIPLLAVVPAATKAPTHFSTIQKQFRYGLLPWQKALFGSIRKAAATNTLFQLLNQSIPVMIVSNASVQKNGNGGFAWIIAQNTKLLWQGTGLVLGPEEDSYSGRAEAYGLLAAITFCTFYVGCYEVPPHTTTIPCYCGNAGVITNLTTMKRNLRTRPNDTTNDDRDLYMAITDAASKGNALNFKDIHVKGHQDKATDHELTPAKKHNVECDCLAKLYVKNSALQSTTLPTLEFPVAQLHLIIHNKVICRRTLLALHNTPVITEYHDYLQNDLHGPKPTSTASSGMS